MSGGQHNPNGRPAQLGSWNHLQVPYLGRVPQAAHMASERAGVTWHTPTPPLHPYHPTGDSDTLQALKVGAGLRHTPTPPERDAILYRHTPTPPDKLFRHTPSPGDGKAGVTLPPADIYPLPLQPREKMRAEELLAYARGGVDLTLGRQPAANGGPLSLSVRDAPTINSLLTAASARAPRPAHTRVDALLERLTPQPHCPHSVIVHPPLLPPSPSPPDSNDDSMDSVGAPPGVKRKRKPERTVRLPVSPAPPPRAPTPPQPRPSPRSPPRDATVGEPRATTPAPPDAAPPDAAPLENGDAPHEPTDVPPASRLPHARRKTKSGSAETIDDIAAMIASTDRADVAETERKLECDEPPATVEVLKSVLGSPEPTLEADPTRPGSSRLSDQVDTRGPAAEPEEVVKAPKRRSTRSSRSDASVQRDDVLPDVKSAEKSAESVSRDETDEPSIVDVENQLEQMFAGIEERAPSGELAADTDDAQPKKRRRSRVGSEASRGKGSRRSDGAPSANDDGSVPRTKAARKHCSYPRGKKREAPTSHRDAYDSGSNASWSRSRGPYVQICGPRDSPLSVSVVNAASGEEDSARGEFRNGLKSRGLHCSTLSVRYDASTPDASWVCAFCELGPHAGVGERLHGPARPLGDLFGPYAISTACEQYRALDESRRCWHAGGGDGDEAAREVWFHEECGLWAPGLLAAGARLAGLQAAVWGARAARCGRCGRAGAAVVCATRACPARAHVNCARTTLWQLFEEEFRALCPQHRRA